MLDSTILPKKTDHVVLQIRAQKVKYLDQSNESRDSFIHGSQNTWPVSMETNSALPEISPFPVGARKADRDETSKEANTTRDFIKKNFTWDFIWTNYMLVQVRIDDRS